MKLSYKNSAAYGFLVVLIAVQPLQAVGLRDALYAVQRKVCTRDGALVAMGVVTTYCLMRDVARERARKGQVLAQMRDFKNMREEIYLLRTDVRNYAQSLTDFSTKVIGQQQLIDNRMKPIEELCYGEGVNRGQQSFRYTCLKTLLSTGVRVNTSKMASVEMVGSDEDAYSTPMGAGAALANLRKNDSLPVAATVAATVPLQPGGGEAQNIGGCHIM